jgi:hypothetical protein
MNVVHNTSVALVPGKALMSMPSSLSNGEIPFNVRHRGDQTRRMPELRGDNKLSSVQSSTTQLEKEDTLPAYLQDLVVEQKIRELSTGNGDDQFNWRAHVYEERAKYAEHSLTWAPTNSPVLAIHSPVIVQLAKSSATTKTDVVRALVVAWLILIVV